MAALHSATYLPVNGEGTALLPRGISAPVSRYERFRTTGRYGDMWAPQLSAILWKLDQGYLDDWADLVEFALCSDADLASLYVTRIARVSQAEFVVKPSKFGDQQFARLAAEFCNEQLARIEDFQRSQRHLLHAIFVGTAFGEMVWARDATTATNYVRHIEPLHTHRFRYDEKWQPRLYDAGQRKGSSLYGEALDPRRFIVHQHQEIAGYPSVSGVMRPAIWIWLLMRWAEKWYAMAVEKYGAPFVVATVAKNTPESVRNELQTALENFTADHAAVKEEGGAIEFFTSPLATAGDSMHSVYLTRKQQQLSKLILGASDIVDPGANGSQAAVGVRAGVATDPRMVVDGTAWSGTIESQYFKWMLALNTHKFGGVMPPVPTYEAKTAGDEVTVDQQDAATQSKGAVKDPNAGFKANEAAADSGVTLAITSGADSPKVPRRSSRGRQTAEAMTRTSSPAQMTLPTSLASATKLARALRGE